MTKDELLTVRDILQMARARVMTVGSLDRISSSIEAIDRDLAELNAEIEAKELVERLIDRESSEER